MGFATANGQDVIGARVTVPRFGAWHADLATVSDAGDLGSKVALSLNGVDFTGTTRRGGSFLDTPMARVVGGAGGLNRPASPRQYRAVALRAVVLDILGAGGEALSPSSSVDLLNAFLPFWVVKASAVGAALTSLLAEFPEAGWRVLLDGSVWVGSETWPASGLTDYEFLRADPVSGTDHVYADVPSITPGTVFRSQRVSCVEHSLTEENFRTVLWYEPTP